jgi:hypothetical protein
MTYNLKLIEGSDKENANFIKVELQKNKIVKYTPKDIDEYGLKDDRIYVSKQISVNNTAQRLFLERLSHGKVTLFYFKNRNRKYFFIEKDSSVLIQISKYDSLFKKKVFKKELGELFEDCNNVKNAIKLSSYSKKSLSLLVKNYNTCQLKPMPHFKFGLLVGFNITHLYSSSNTSDEYLKDAAFNIDKSFSLGAFCDLPLYLGNLYFHPEIHYFKNAFLYNFKNENIETDVVINNSSIYLPILLRYTFPNIKLQPFASLGAIYSRAIKNENAIYRSQKYNGVVEINKINSSKFLSGNHIGPSFGLGSQFDINYRQSVSIELRYNKLYSLNSTLPLKKDVLNVIIGFNF